VLQVLGHEPETALLRQTGIGMAMHGCVKPGWMGRTSTRSASHPFVTDQPAETEKPDMVKITLEN